MIVLSIVVLYTVCILVGGDTLVWSDEFDGPSGQLPDSSNWGYDIGGEGWGNQELEYYTNSATNAALDGNGNLVITARQENNNDYHCWYGLCQYTSARLLTAGKFSQLYGAIEARIKIPKGQGIWPAFWMLGENISQVGWPQCGEIDVMENIGREPLAIHGTLHGPGYSAADGLTSTYQLPNNQPFSDDFHVYRVDWIVDSITFSVDGQQYATKTPEDAPGKKWVFDHNFFIILNVAVGGGWPGPPDSSTSFPQSMVIDYVKVYSTNGRHGQIKSAEGQCMDVLGAGKENWTPVQLYDCNSSATQQWIILGNGTIRAFDKCLGVSNAINGAIVQVYDCNGSDTQKWDLSPAGNISNKDKCVEVNQLGNITFLQLLDCNGTANQKWTVP